MPEPGATFGPAYDDFERLIVQCWGDDPMLRPTFLEVMNRLNALAAHDGSHSSKHHGASSSSSSSSSSTMAPRGATDNTASFSSDGSSKHHWENGALAQPHDDLAATVAVVADIHRADALWTQAPHATEKALATLNEILRTTARHYNGHETQLDATARMGEGTFCAVFAGARQAFGFCRAVQGALLACDWDADLLRVPEARAETSPDGALVFAGPRVRMGVHAGRLRIAANHHTRRYEYSGPAIHIAASLAQVAQGGRVLLTTDTARAPDAGSDFDISPLEDGELMVFMPGGGSPVEVETAELHTLPDRKFEPHHLGHRAASSLYDDDGDNNGTRDARRGMAATTARSVETMLGTASACRSVIKFEDIRLQEEIGRGTYGIVHRGQWKGVDVAFKRLARQRLGEKDRNNLYREMAVLPDLRHPNVVLFIGACIASPNVGIVTEFVADGSLRDLLARASVKIPWRARVDIVRDIAAGLNYLHTMEPNAILHRDLKSSNVLVVAGRDGSWTAKLADFGFANVKDQMSTMTRCGTPAWTAPEIMAGEKHYSGGVRGDGKTSQRRADGDVTAVCVTRLFCSLVPPSPLARFICQLVAVCTTVLFFLLGSSRQIWRCDHRATAKFHRRNLCPFANNLTPGALWDRPCSTILPGDKKSIRFIGALRAKRGVRDARVKYALSDLAKSGAMIRLRGVPAGGGAHFFLFRNRLWRIGPGSRRDQVAPPSPNPSFRREMKRG
jgi:class 3 adenylate cyclase/tRNA A-37 threonylcarbamoyl transferase component Bud32